MPELRADVVPLAYDWSGYQTIVLPTVISSVRRGYPSASRTSPKTGGTVIVGYATGLIDEHFHIGFGGYPGAGNGLLRDMLGIRSEEFNILGEEAEDEPSRNRLVEWTHDTSVAE
ncbi:MAG: beta-galactosidase trimerization domain-containing protein [Bifidobacterium longum]